jgi:hypothetical protein
MFEVILKMWLRRASIFERARLRVNIEQPVHRFRSAII